MKKIRSPKTEAVHQQRDKPEAVRQMAELKTQNRVEEENMNRHILAATDGSNCAHRALQYAASLYRDVDDVNITLITVAEPVPQYLHSGSASAAVELSRLDKIDEFMARREEECRKILDAGARQLVKAGFPEERIEKKEIVQSQGIARDILFAARQGKHDAILAGTRGTGNVAAYFTGSVSRELVEYGKNTPVWLIDRPSENPRHVLAAVDACEVCLRVLDHAAFALAGIEGVKITVFHVIPKFRPFISNEESMDFDEIEKFVAKASEKKVKSLLSGTKDIFIAAGFDHSCIDIKIKHGSTGVASDILHEYRSGKYGTLVIGRRGIGGWEAIFPGSVSNRLMNSVEKGAVWIVE